jgi:hypothetical protein
LVQGKGTNIPVGQSVLTGRRLLMPFDFELDRERRIVLSRASGSVTDEELLDHMARTRELFKAGVLNSTWAQIADFSEAEDASGVSSIGVARLSEGNPWPRGTARVVIAPKDVQFGLARMYQLLGDLQDHGLEVTRSVADALEFVERRRAQN